MTCVSRDLIDKALGRQGLIESDLELPRIKVGSILAIDKRKAEVIKKYRSYILVKWLDNGQLESFLRIDFATNKINWVVKRK